MGKPKSKDSIANTRAYRGLELEGWDFFERFDLAGKLVLRHNADVQMSIQVNEGEDFANQLRILSEECRAHRYGNPKITGAIKVVQHSRLNGLPLLVAMNREINRTVSPGSRFAEPETKCERKK